MAKFTRLLIGACVAIVALAMFTDPALALRSLQTSSPGPMEGTGANITFEEGEGFLRTVCAGLTLSGEGNERVPKSLGATVGAVTNGQTTGCRAFGLFNAAVTIEATRTSPFGVSYKVILGSLPVITETQWLIEGVKFSIVAAGRTCRYHGTSGIRSPVVRESRGELTYEGGSFLTEQLKILTREGSSMDCPRQGFCMGRLRLERTRTIRLV